MHARVDGVERVVPIPIEADAPQYQQAASVSVRYLLTACNPLGRKQLLPRT